MKLETVLTVAQSKRLIAWGVVQHPYVKAAFHNGIIGICRGTTCSAVAEEFLGRAIEKFSYTTGVTLPKNPFPEITPPKEVQHDIIIRHGEIHMDGEMVTETAKNMSPGDVIIKGANALNYREGIAGCLVGHPAGGTSGGFWGPLYGRKLHLIIPVGLEKEVSCDILEASAECMEENSGNALMPLTGTIITEIEALGILTGVSAIQIAAGGIRGAEGSVRLLASGNQEEIREVDKIISALENEKPY
ncbi:MAG: hypothetical protein WCU00_02495 [Candidatus Latescibacterota bacterium]